MTPASQRADAAPDRAVTVRFAKPVTALPGDVITWDTGPARVSRGRLHALACDNLAGVAAALSAMSLLSAKRERADVRVLLTRAEEVGFVGAIAACLSGALPPDARVIVLENSKSFAESPIGGGPILRVGDRTSTFDPELTHRLGAAAQELAAKDAGFTWQRKLMPGGTCEATAYQALGRRAACLCLPLGCYHNMDERRQRIAPEHIALADFAGLVAWLVHAAPALARDGRGDPLADRMRSLHASRRALLDEPA
jgi:endoglucanase